MTQSHHKAFWLAAVVTLLMLLVCACGPDYTVIGDITPEPSEEVLQNTPAPSTDPGQIEGDAGSTDNDTPMDGEEGTPDVSVIEGNQGSENEESPNAAYSTIGNYEPGTYTATADGYNGLLSVEVTVDESKILGIVVTDQTEDSDRDAVRDAILDLPDAIIAEQSLSVDTVSGATATSNAILDAVNFALELAGVIEE